MTESDFSREAFYGICFYWFAVDCEERIGIFTAGYSPVPRLIFDGGSRGYERYRDMLLDLPETSGAVLSAHCRAVGRQLPGVDFSENEAESRRGFFSFEESGQGGPYRLYCSPTRPLLLDEAPTDVREELKKLTIDGVLFRENALIDIRDHFDC